MGNVSGASSRSVEDCERPKPGDAVASPFRPAGASSRLGRRPRLSGGIQGAATQLTLRQAPRRRGRHPLPAAAPVSRSMGHAEVQAAPWPSPAGVGVPGACRKTRTSALRPLADELRCHRLDGGSPVNREVHAGFYEGRGVRLPPATRLSARLRHGLIENTVGYGRGEVNQWTLTPTGRQAVAHGIDPYRSGLGLVVGPSFVSRSSSGVITNPRRSVPRRRRPSIVTNRHLRILANATNSAS